MDIPNDLSPLSPGNLILITKLKGMVEELYGLLRHNNSRMVGQWQYLDIEPEDDVAVGELLDRASDLLAEVSSSLIFPE